MTYDAKYSGRYYSLVNGEVYTINRYGKMVYAGALTGQNTTVQLTGYIVTTEKGSTLHQTTGDGYIYLPDGWQQVQAGYRREYSQAQAQELVNTIIRNNKAIVSNNLVCARFAYKLTSDQLAQLRALQGRVETRNKALADSGLVTNISSNYPAGYAYLQPYLESVMNGQGTAGVGSVTVTIIVAAIVIASLSTAAYFAYQAYAAESVNDAKFSKELTATLVAKLTPEEYEQLLAETKGIVTKSRLSAALSSYWSLAKYAAVGLGVYFVLKLIK